MTHLLVLDAYTPDGRKALRSAGGTEAGRLYHRMIERLAPAAQIDIHYPADLGEALPVGAALEQYDGALWTGSSLTIYHHDDPRVRNQIELQKRLFEVRVPTFGSCWATQLAVVAAGGDCAANPNGREFGVARAIALSAEGREHDLYRGRPTVFDGFTCHADMVTSLPTGATLLASNEFTKVQAVSVDHRKGSFWGVQYHPEYDLHEVASLCRLRASELIQQGDFRDQADADLYIERLETLHDEPQRVDLVEALGLDDQLLDFEQRVREVRNWLELKVWNRQ